MPKRDLTWPELRKLVRALVKERGIEGEHLRRLKFELKEIDKQGANAYWLELFNEKYTYQANKNGLVLPWLLGMTKVDPIGNNVELKIGDDDGIEEDAIVLISDNGEEIVISPYTSVMTGRGWVAARDIKIGDKLKNIKIGPEFC